MYSVLEGDPGLQGPWGKRRGSNMLHPPQQALTLPHTRSQDSEVGRDRSRKDLRTEASVSNTLRTTTRGF